jgi:Putative Ig domain
MKIFSRISSLPSSDGYKSPVIRSPKFFACRAIRVNGGQEKSLRAARGAWAKCSSLARSMSGVAFWLVPVTLMLTTTGAVALITRNAHGVTDVGATSTASPITVALSNVAAGDLIVCEVSLEAGVTFTSVSDPSNGVYLPAITLHTNTKMTQQLGIYFVANAVAGSYSVSMAWTGGATNYQAMACQSWTGVATSSPQDTTMTEQQDKSSTANPTAGSTKTPAAAGELIIGNLMTSAHVPTAGTNYTLTDSASATYMWPEYWVQTTATATDAPYTNSSDNWTDQMVAFGPASFTAVAPPVITSATTASGTVGSAFTYQIVATNSPTSYGATGLPAGLTVSTTTGLISGTPTAAGTSTVTLSASNSGGTGNATLALTISNSAAPVITSATTASGTVGSAFTYQIVATNSPTSYGATGLPAGLSVSTTTGLISGTPTAAGTSTVTLSASNGAGTGNATLTLTIVAAGQTFQLIHLSESSGCGNETTCSVALTGNVTAGNLLVITSSTVTSGIKISSISAGGTFISGNLINGAEFVSTPWLDGGYVYPATATSGPIVVTFSGSTGGAQVNIREYSVPSGAATALDALGSVYNSSVNSPFNGFSLKLSGANDLVVQWAVANTDVSAVSSPYGNVECATDETGMCSADNLNTTSGNAPTWTASGASDAVVAAMAFGIGVTPCQNYTLVDFSAGTSGNSPTLADLLSSTFGAYGTIIGSGSETNFYWSTPNGDTAITYQTGAYHALSGTMPRFCQGGATYVDNPSTPGVEYNNGIGGSGEQDLRINLPTFLYSSQAVTSGMYFMTTIPATDTGGWVDIHTIWQYEQGNYTNISLETQAGGANQLGIFLECCGVTSNDFFPIQSNTWYWITSQQQPGGTDLVQVYDVNNNALLTHNGAQELSGAEPGTNPVASISFGRNGGYGTPTAGYVQNYDKMIYCWTGNCPFPLLPQIEP